MISGVLSAFVDESCRQRSGEDTAVYVLAAVLVESEQAEVVQSVLESVRYGRSTRVHWRVERPERRGMLAKTVAGLPITGVVTVCLHHSELVKSERARRLCLRRLLVELSGRGVDQVCSSRGRRPWMLGTGRS